MKLFLFLILTAIGAHAQDFISMPPAVGGGTNDIVFAVATNGGPVRPLAAWQSPLNGTTNEFAAGSANNTAFVSTVTNRFSSFMAGVRSDDTTNVNTRAVINRVSSEADHLVITSRVMQVHGE